MPLYTKSNYVYVKLRKNFGRQPLFQCVPPQLLDSINPDVSEQKLYALRNPVDRHVQATMPQSVHDLNTKPLVTHEQGINHTEGGWPRDIHVHDEEHVNRHRRRVLHDDNYVHTVKNLAPVMAHYVDQNNAIDMYQSYFAEMSVQQPVETYSIRIANVFRDPFQRPISCIVWTNEKKSKLAVSYCDRTLTQTTTLDKFNTCYLWDTSIQNKPAHTLVPLQPCWQLACSPKNSEVIIGGLQNGTVCLFDIRVSDEAMFYSSVYHSHRGPVTSLLFIHSRSQTEFFTGSSDGQCLWWDDRNLSKPIDQLPMSIKIPDGEGPNLGNAEGVSTFEFNHSLSTRFLCGTESGYVINVNRMGREHSEKLSLYWEAHSGPVRAVLRSPCTTRMFLTCGDFSVRIWSEEVRTAPIIVTKPYRYQVNDAVWAPLRYSCYMSACAGGVFYYWDLLRKSKEPVKTLKVSEHGITKLATHESGQYVAIGDNNGTVHLAVLSDNMTIPGNNDKTLMHQLYERETKREHILDNRVKEIYLKQHGEEYKEDKAEDGPDEEEAVEAAEAEYFKMVKQELQGLNLITTSVVDSE